ncbi:MAG: hypothetical protein KUG78_10945 [Kangiellaceae bacterium]|nr:hypothetical protein [Kangiellaceae bacterium]
MTNQAPTWWDKNKYLINGLVLILIGYYLYQSLNPKFPDLWEPKQVGEFELTPMPFDLEQPYLHHGVYTKDFFLFVNKGNVKNIRQAYINIGNSPSPLSELELTGNGILHGSQHGQEVHAIAPERIASNHKMWLTLENWQGQQFITSWDIPSTFQKQR